MKKIYSLITMLVVALTGLSLTACSNDDLDTNQYQGGVSLNVYGPTPVMRGGQLRFIGSNLDQVREVIIPDGISITNIEVVKAGVPSEIRVTIPKDGPVPGLVTLVTNSDQRIITKTELNYIEGIEITSVTASAMPGDVIKIEGDYLNLIYSLAFADNVLVGEADFVSHDRYAIEVRVPEDAKTGKLELYTADLTVVDKNSVEYQTIITEDAVEIGLPTISKLAGRAEASAQGAITAKTGETITITGSYYNVVSAVNVGGYEITDITVSSDGKAITFALPAEAPGGDIVLVTKSGVEVPVGTLETVKPANGVAAPNPVKAGAELTISGDDMDVVTAVEFPGADALTDNKITVAADKVVVTAVPEKATEGNLKLIMANGESVEVAFTLVKPTVTAYNANPVSAGAELQITGTDLDLVKTINFGDGTATVEEDNVSADGTTITITVPMEATTAKPEFVLANGVKVEGAELTINEALFCYITEMPEFNEDNTPEAGDVLTVPVKNADKLTNVYVNGTEVNYVYSDKNSTLTFGIPENAKAKSTVKLVSSNGEIEYTISVVPAGEVTTMLWQGPEALDWSTSIQIPSHTFDDLSTSDENTLIINYTADSDDAAAKFYDGHWTNIAIPGYYVGDDGSKLLALPKESNEVRVPITAEFLAELTNPDVQDWGASLIFHGSGATINSVKLSTKISMATTIWTGELSMGTSWGASGTITADKFADAHAGSVITIYFTEDDGDTYWQVKFMDSSWNALSSYADVDNGWGCIPLEDGATSCTITLNAADAASLKASGAVISGFNITYKKITIE